jgi:two-component system sensor histidine kinase BaeS
MRSISSKLILAFLSIGIVSIAILGVIAVLSTRAEFIRFLSDQTRTSIVNRLADYHQTYGSWERAEAIFVYDHHSQMPAMGTPHMGMGRPPFALANENGRIIIPNGPYRRGELLSATDLEESFPITENGKVIGFLISTRAPYQGQPRELEFFARINKLLLLGGLISTVMALLLGVLLSRTLTHPIRELTQATHAVSAGDLSQQVPVRSNDELGELAKAFNKMSSELSRSINARKQMTADIAHELRTPLSLILGHAEAVHDGVLPPTRENFEIIREEATRLEHLVNDLRLLSLADAGELSITLQAVAPQALLQDVVAAYQYRAQQKKITFTLDIAPSLPSIEVDPDRMTQVLKNVVDNALRHTPEGGTIVLSASEGGERVDLAIQDSGPGLPAAELERIFERFYRTDASRQREELSTGGSGLGLAIARSIVQAHGGQVRAESEEGKGLKIIISLPKRAG